MKPANEDVLRRYLLGRMDPESRDGIEARLFSDDQVFWERLNLAEDELIDAYAAGTLDDEEKVLFDTSFLSTNERRAKLEFALALGAYAEQRRDKRRGSWDWLRVPVAAPRWVLATAATLMLLLPGVVWRIAPGGGSPTDVTVSLASGLLRDGGGELKRVLAPAACQLVHLELSADPEPYAGYSATVYEVGGEEIWSKYKLVGIARDGSVAVRLTLPCESLPEGDYWVRLRGVMPGREPIPLDRYDFRVLRD